MRQFQAAKGHVVEHYTKTTPEGAQESGKGHPKPHFILKVRKGTRAESGIDNKEGVGSGFGETPKSMALAPAVWLAPWLTWSLAVRQDK